MRVSSIISIGLVALSLTLGGRATYLEIQGSQREHFALDTCSLVENYLETDAVREAFEGMQQAFIRSEFRDVCINVIASNGKNYAPDCVDPSQSYKTVICKAEGNRGIRAEIHYPESPFFIPAVLTIWLLLWLGFVIATLLLRLASGHIAKRITQELKVQLFDEAPPAAASFIANRVNWVLAQTGVLKGVQTQTQKFGSQIRDYESRMKSEIALRTKKEVEAEKSREYIERIRDIRHNIRSPLTSLLTVREILQGDEQARQTLTSAIRGIQVMLDDLSQVDKKVTEPKLAIAEVIAEEAVVLLQYRYKSAKGVNLILHYDSSCLSPILVVAEEMKSIFENLLENAFSAVPAGGQITLKIESTESQCRIHVDDNGCGIAPELIPNLFQKGATARKINGSGLGLYHCKKTIESWKGNVQHEPLNSGTRFTLTIPLVQTGVGYVGLPRERRLLVIDDDPTVVESLASAGYQIEGFALTFEEGRRLLSNPRTSDVAVLVDYKLSAEHIGTDLIMDMSDANQVFLCTNDFEDGEVIRRAHQVGVKIIPKPLCFLADPKSE